MSNKKLLENLIRRIIKEESSPGQPNKKNVKIKYIPIDKSVYARDTMIEFQISINGKTATGFWEPSYGEYVSNGVEVNELSTGGDRYGKRIIIFPGGGTQRYYEISAELKQTGTQPKNLRFTGPRLSIDNLKSIFVDKISKAINNPNSEPKLSNEFLTYFELI